MQENNIMESTEHSQHEKVTYPAKHFIDNTKLTELVRVIEHNPLATLIYCDNAQQLHLSHIPFHFSNKLLKQVKVNQCQSLIAQQLIGHVSNKHPIALQLNSQVNSENNCKANSENRPLNISLIFHGEDAYISPNDVSVEYRSMQKVPTWNYAKVHVEGYLTEVSCLQKKLQQMTSTTEYFEKSKGNKDAQTKDKSLNWSIEQAPEKAIEQMLKAITVFTLTITSIEGRFKLSQNKPTQVREQINQQLLKS